MNQMNNSDKFEPLNNNGNMTDINVNNKLNNDKSEQNDLKRKRENSNLNGFLEE